MDFDFFVVDVLSGSDPEYLENYESIVWTRKLNEPGECEITAPITEGNLSLLRLDNIVINPNKARLYLEGSATGFYDAMEACIITSVEIDDAAHTITAKGKGLEYLLSYRINAQVEKMPDTCNAAKFSDTLQGFIDSFIRLFGSVPLFLDGGVGPTYTIGQGTGGYSPRPLTVDPVSSFEASWNDYLELVQKMMNANPAYSFGCFWVIYEYGNVWSKNYVGFEVIRNRDTDAIFSDELDNLSGFKIDRSSEGWCSGGLVLGDGEGSGRVSVWYPTIQKASGGLADRYSSVDARDMQAGDYASDNAYRTALFDRGREKMVERVTTYEFEVDATTQFKYREDFYIGDSVNIVSKKYGVSLTAQVAQAVETYSADGYKVAISVGNVRENLAQRLNKRYGR